MTILSLKNRNRLRGTTVLVLTAMLLLSATLIVIFAGNYSQMQSKITSNQYRGQQAFQAAQAGLEFGLAYLIQNSSTILATPSGGYILPFSNASTTNVTLSNNSKYSIVYTNPIANNYNLILITSTGTSDDGTSTRVVSEEFYAGSDLIAYGSYALVSKGTLSMSGNTTVTNTQTNNTLEAGGSVAGNGNFKTITGNGTSSTSGNYSADIQQNVTSLANTANADLFSGYFGMTEAQYISKAAHTYTNASNYATTLNGLTGTTVYINQTSGSANFSGSATIGTPSSPVLIVIDGNLNISGNFTLYGFIFVNGASSTTTNLSGNITIIGGVATTDNVSASGNLNVTYNNAVLNGVQSSTSYFARVPGAWKDF
jgi:Tfp pilus assembly protein PilX